MIGRRTGMRLGLAVLLATAATSVAAQMVVISARGSPFKVGQRVEAGRAVTLKPGEQVTMIAADGRSVTLRGPYSGPAASRAAGSAAGGSGQALAALMASRSARVSAVGVVRSGADAATLPDPWLIDISRPGSRCLKPGVAPIWWRPDASRPLDFTVFPIDRSWRADFRWAAGQDRMAVPPLAKFDTTTSFIVRIDGDETLIMVERAPEALDNDLMIAQWLIERNCVQQADAMLRTLQRADARP